MAARDNDASVDQQGRNEDCKGNGGRSRGECGESYHSCDSRKYDVGVVDEDELPRVDCLSHGRCSELG